MATEEIKLTVNCEETKNSFEMLRNEIIQAWKKDDDGIRDLNSRLDKNYKEKLTKSLEEIKKLRKENELLKQNSASMSDTNRVLWVRCVDLLEALKEAFEILTTGRSKANALQRIYDVIAKAEGMK